MHRGKNDASDVAALCLSVSTTTYCYVIFYAIIMRLLPALSQELLSILKWLKEPHSYGVGDLHLRAIAVLNVLVVSITELIKFTFKDRHFTDELETLR